MTDLYGIPLVEMRSGGRVSIGMPLRDYLASVLGAHGANQLLTVIDQWRLYRLAALLAPEVRTFQRRRAFAEGVAEGWQA